jgi:hypothetical protein
MSCSSDTPLRVNRVKTRSNVTLEILLLKSRTHISFKCFTRIDVFDMVLSEKQKLRLQVQGRFGENRRVAAGMLGIRQGALNSCNTRIFMDFVELLDVMNEYYPVFERRFRHSPECLRGLRSLMRKIRKSNSS